MAMAAVVPALFAAATAALNLYPAAALISPTSIHPISSALLPPFRRTGTRRLLCTRLSSSSSSSSPSAGRRPPSEAVDDLLSLLKGGDGDGNVEGVGVVGSSAIGDPPRPARTESGSTSPDGKYRAVADLFREVEASSADAVEDAGDDRGDPFEPLLGLYDVTYVQTVGGGG